MLNRLLLLLLVVLVVPGCRKRPQVDKNTVYSVPEISEDVLKKVPEWAQKAIWYQIFPERFRNGDPNNDPRMADMEGAWPHTKFPGWKPTFWGQDWFAQEDWALTSGKDFYFTVQARRYGGDFQGIIDKMDYLKDLGINAIYLNPVNDSPSLHKYDARNYHHMDRNFGTDPDGDMAMMKREKPEDPSTWEWTSADKLFLKLIETAHKHGIRVVVDYSWNHTGKQFWAFQDVMKNGKKSKFADWYYIDQFDDVETPDTNEFVYRGWANVKELPELKKVDVKNRIQGRAYEGNLHPEVKQHIFAVTSRWMDPNGDGDPSDGVDGFRLDVAEQVPLGFWREYRRFVRGLNPEAVLIGEIWWEKYPDVMTDPAPYLQGDVFDGVMNYRWYKSTREFIGYITPAMSGAQYARELEALKKGIAEPFQKGMMNVTGTHDTERLQSSLFNKGRYKVGVNPRENKGFKVGKPDPVSVERQKMLLVQQFTYTGAPQIFYGDEVGMWGADDPDNRKPMLWDDIAFQNEKSVPFKDMTRSDDVLTPDTGLLAFYKKLIAMRTRYADLFVEAPMEVVFARDGSDVVIYRRAMPNSNKMALIFINKGAGSIPMNGNLVGDIQQAMKFINPLNEAEQYTVTPEQPNISFYLGARSYKVLVSGE